MHFVRTFRTARVSRPSSHRASNSPSYIALRHAVQAAGITPATAAILLQARATGLDWELASTAVSEGLTARAGQPTADDVPMARRRIAWRPMLLTLAAYILLRPVLGFGHEVAVAGVAWLAHALVGTGSWSALIGALGLDPIYAGAAIRALGGVDVVGLAVADPLGAWLHSLLPSIFVAPDQVAPGAGVSMVAAVGTPALGRGLAALGADVVWLAVGLALFWRWRERRWPIALLGLLLQAQIGINHFFGAPINLREVEATGLPFALALALPSLSRDAWFTVALGRQPQVVQDLIVGGTLLLVGYAAALALVVPARAAWRRFLRWRVGSHADRPRSTVRPSRSLATIGATAAVLVAISPIGALAFGQSNWHAGDGRGLGHRPRSPGALAHMRAALADPATLGPSIVHLERDPNGVWRYLVNGEPTIMRGVGYNPQYLKLDQAERERLYQRDFSAMRRTGVNTIEGWFEQQFDSVTLDAAARNGVGVIMPFEINQDWDLTNVNVRQSILDHVSAMVEKYRDHPAVRMWAPGNENLHRILYPRWVSQEGDPAARARADAFAAFLPVLVDRIHELDPDHPVIYRDAEDVYLARLKSAFEATGVERPWLVYGANVYSPNRLQEVIARWPAQWIGGPLVISEYAPGGAGPTDRPLGFQQDWAIIRSRPDLVLGGLAYTWSTNGPEELDRVFGLVDADGKATDGALAALSNAYLSDW
jgi:hypothetical protein